eukprot:1280823-Rhodomonas_salina.1
MFGLEKVVPSVVGSFKGEKPQPFGHGDPEAEEQNCKDFQVFMECRGYYNQDRTKKVLKARPWQMQRRRLGARWCRSAAPSTRTLMICDSGTDTAPVAGESVGREGELH